MPAYKLDLIMQANGKGWRETYYRQFSGDIGSVNTVAVTLAEKRAALNGNPVVIEAYSVSDPLTPGRQGESFYFNPPIVAAPPLVAISTAATGAASPSASINIRWLSSVNNATRRTQMRGILDGAITDFNQLESAAYGAWYKAFLTLRTYLLQQQFGWIRTPQLKESVVSYAFVGAAQVPTFTFSDETFFDVLLKDKFVSLRFSKFNGSRSPLNRELVCQVTSQNTAVAAVPIAAGPMTTVGKAIQYGTPVFVAADNIGVERVGRRATGRPLLRTPGRARAKARS